MLILRSDYVGAKVTAARDPEPRGVKGPLPPRPRAGSTRRFLLSHASLGRRRTQLRAWPPVRGHGLLRRVPPPPRARRPGLLQRALPDPVPAPPHARDAPLRSPPASPLSSQTAALVQSQGPALPFLSVTPASHFLVSPD